jgi:quercetin dioxygenase-like cupin family protein
MISPQSEGRTDTPYPGIQRTTRDGAHATIVEYRFAPGASFPRHHHTQEQVTIVLEGRVELECEGERQILEAGDWVCTEGGERHGISVHDAPAHFLIVIAPPRAQGESPQVEDEADSGATA